MAYENVRQRSRRIGEDIEKLLHRIDELEEANRKLRAMCEGYEQHAEARERVLASLSKNA
jgi:hypothetical protein